MLEKTKYVTGNGSLLLPLVGHLVLFWSCCPHRGPKQNANSGTGVYAEVEEIMDGWPSPLCGLRHGLAQCTSKHPYFLEDLTVLCWGFDVGRTQWQLLVKSSMGMIWFATEG